MLTDADVTTRARGLASALEPFAGQVYFSPECHKNYEALGFSPSVGEFGGVAAPDGPAYFCSRGSVMGQVPGQLIAAAFGVFNPEIVVMLVDLGWKLTDAATICQARTDGAVAQLERILGAEPEGLAEATDLLARAVAPLRPEGRPLYAGLLSLGLPGTPMGDAWRLADLLREYRGDAHTAAWTSAGLTATEIGLVSELSWGLPARSYSRTRSWSDAQFDAAEADLVATGWMADGTLTEHGAAAREAIEAATDRQCRPFIEALGDDLDRLVALLAPWGAAIRDAKGYPASGPHDLADAVTR